MESALSATRGTSRASAETFAVHALKVVDASTYAGEVTKVDSRITYKVDALGVNAVNSKDFIDSVINMSPTLIANLRLYEDIDETYEKSLLPNEKAAAILVGVVRRMAEVNNV
jgi:hypothetical protein